MSMLCRLTLVAQAVVLDGMLFEPFPCSQDGFAALQAYASRCQPADAFVGR